MTGRAGGQVDGPASQAVPSPEPAHWSGVFAMSLCVFALIASEFMPVSLLTPIAADLRVSEGQVGWGIAVSGLFAVVTSLMLPSIVGRMSRKTLLLWLTALMGVSGGVISLANRYEVYLLGRALIGVAVGGFWSLSAATAMRLVPLRLVPRALAIFNGGNALATVVAAPLGSYLGAVAGWRSAFGGLVPLALIAFAWQAASLPTMRMEGQVATTGNVFRLLQSRVVACGMLAVAAFFMGQFALFTYLRPFLESVTHVGDFTLSLLLLAIGVAGLMGTVVIGAVVQHGLYRTLWIAPVLMAAIAAALIACGDDLLTVGVLLAAWGFIATAAPVAWWTWIAKTLPHDAETGGGLMVAVVQLAIGLGSAVGGMLFDGLGYRSSFTACAVTLLVSAVLVFATARRDSGRA